MKFWHLLRFGTLDHDFRRERDDDGRLVLICSACRHQQSVLTEKVKRDGPAHRQRVDKGTVTTKAKPDRKGNRIEFPTRESQR